MINDSLFISIAILVWGYVFFKCKIKDSKLLIVTILLIIVIPGIKIGGVLINPCDLLIPIIFFKVLIKSKKKLQKQRIFHIIIIYLVFIFISIVIAAFRLRRLDLVSIMKFVRICYIPLAYYIGIKTFKKEDLISILKWIVISGIICATLGIIFFINQKTIYNPTEQMQIGSRVLYRAGGVFGEATTFGNMLLIEIIISFSILFGKLGMKKICSINIILSVIALAMSYSRSSFLAMAICLILLIIIFKKINIKTIFKIIILFIILGLLIVKVNFLNQFMIHRILPMFTVNSDNVNQISSGRIVIWRSEITILMSNAINIFFGMGYKVRSELTGLMGMADNNFVSAFVQTGISGLVMLIIININIIKESLKKRYSREKKYEILRKAILVIWCGVIIQMITSDTFTFYRNMMFIFVLIGYRDSYYTELRGEKNEIFTNSSNIK